MDLSSHGWTLRQRRAALAQLSLLGTTALIMNWRESRLIGFDVETTGLDPVRDRIVQLAFTTYTPGNDVFGPEYERRCGSDGVELPPEASLIHNIWPEDIVDKPPADALLEELGDFLSDFRREDHIFLAFNACFDTSFLLQAFKRRSLPFPINPMRVLDPLPFARSQWKYNRLPELASRLGVPSGGGHEACKDIRLTIQVMLRIGELLDLPADFDAVLNEQEKYICEWEEQMPYRYRDILDKVLT